MSKPDVLLELGIRPGANGDPNTWFTLGTSELGGSDPLAPDWVFYDLDGFWESIDFDEGYNQEGNAIQPGTIGAVLENRDRRFDKRNTSSPYYPHLRPPAVWLRLTVNGNELKIVRVDSLNPQYTIDETPAPIEGADALSMLAEAPVRFDAIVQPTKDRINTILDIAGWRDPRDIADGAYNMGTYPIDAKALDEINAIAQAEDTLVCMCPSGYDRATFTFFDRADLTGTATVVFTDGTLTGSITEFPYQEIHYADGSATFANQIRVTRRANPNHRPSEPEDKPVAKGYVDWDSVNDLTNGVPVEMNIDDCPVFEDDESQAVADQIGSRYAYPIDRIDRVSLDLVDFNAIKQNELLIYTTIGSIVDVIHHPPPSGAANTQTSIVIGRSLTINNDRTRCVMTFRLRAMDGGI